MCRLSCSLRNNHYNDTNPRFSGVIPEKCHKPLPQLALVAVDRADGDAQPRSNRFRRIARLHQLQHAAQVVGQLGAELLAIHAGNRLRHRSRRARLLLPLQGEVVLLQSLASLLRPLVFAHDIQRQQSQQAQVGRFLVVRESACALAVAQTDLCDAVVRVVWVQSQMQALSVNALWDTDGHRVLLQV